MIVWDMFTGAVLLAAGVACGWAARGRAADMPPDPLAHKPSCGHSGCYNKSRRVCRDVLCPKHCRLLCDPACEPREGMRRKTVEMES